MQEVQPGYTQRSQFQNPDMNHNFFTACNGFPVLLSPFEHIGRQLKTDALSLDFRKKIDPSTCRIEKPYKKNDSKPSEKQETAYSKQFHFSQSPSKKAASPSTESSTDDTKRPLKCDQCDKIFKTKYTLAIHLKMPSHTNARPFVCGTCGKGFRLSSTLCRHKIIHTSAKPHQCHICNKAFNRSSTLKTHVRTHSNVKEFLCEVCGKGFHQKGNLRNHILIHTGEKPYKCNLCEKAFNKLSNLKFHLHVHTDNSPYRCRYCKVSFSRRCDLKQHLTATHQSEILATSA